LNKAFKREQTSLSGRAGAFWTIDPEVDISSINKGKLSQHSFHHQASYLFCSFPVVKNQISEK